jgi:hypothetical protein
MRKLILLLMMLLTIPTWTSGGQRLQDLAHKKRLKKAAKTAPGASKKLLHKKG